MGNMTPSLIEQVRLRADCLFDFDQVESAIDRVAEEITSNLAAANPILLCIMNGGLIFSGKLAPKLDFPLQMDYLHATRYRGNTSGADLHWKAYPALSMADRAVLVVDDILDEGETLERIIAYCREQGASQVQTAVLIDKLHDRKVASVEADYIGLQAEDRYLFGYGMDYKGYLRNAPGIFAIHPSDM